MADLRSSSKNESLGQHDDRAEDREGRAKHGPEASRPRCTDQERDQIRQPDVGKHNASKQCEGCLPRPDGFPEDDNQNLGAGERGEPWREPRIRRRRPCGETDEQSRVEDPPPQPITAPSIVVIGLAYDRT